MPMSFGQRPDRGHIARTQSGYLAANRHSQTRIVNATRSITLRNRQRIDPLIHVGRATIVWRPAAIGPYENNGVAIEGCNDQNSDQSEEHPASHHGSGSINIGKL